MMSGNTLPASAWPMLPPLASVLTTLMRLTTMLITATMSAMRYAHCFSCSKPMPITMAAMASTTVTNARMPPMAQASYNGCCICTCACCSASQSPTQAKQRQHAYTSHPPPTRFSTPLTISSTPRIVTPAGRGCIFLLLFCSHPSDFVAVLPQCDKNETKNCRSCIRQRRLWPMNPPLNSQAGT